MKTIDVDGLPEPVAEALEAIVRTLRAELRAEPQPRPTARPHKVHLATWPGRVIEPLTREEIYDDLF